MMTRPTIALTSRELFPFGGGGIGAYIAETAKALAPVADVTIVTASWYHDKYHELRHLGDPRVDYAGARVAFVDVPEDDDLGDFTAHMHCYSPRLLCRLRELYPTRPPDLVEFPDYLGEGFVATQARRGGDPFLASTMLAVRLHTSAEMCEVLNGHLARRFDRRVTRELERRTLQDADVLLHASDEILNTYQRFYENQLAPSQHVRHPLQLPDPPTVARPTDGPLRMLFVGRLERRKGIEDLLTALTTSTADWRLTVLGRDTPTAPLGASMIRTLRLQAAEDHRITFTADIARAALPATMAAHDLVVLPSHWECWPYVALEAMAAGVPIVAPAVGGFVELLNDPDAGHLATAPGPRALMDVLGPLTATPELARRHRNPQRIRDHVHRLTDANAIRDAYLDLTSEPQNPPGWNAPPADQPPPLVSVVIPYFRMHRFLEDAVRSVLAQTYPRIEILVINDGSFDPHDIALAEIAARHPITVLSQENRGLSGARNFGITQTRGRYVLPLDADNTLDPTFVARTVAVLETQPTIAFVTSWNRYVDETLHPLRPADGGYRPFGNWSTLVHERNGAGDGTALLRRSLFDRHRYNEHLTSYEDWALYRTLHDAHEEGLVLPDVLWSYRVREDSMLRTVAHRHDERLQEELDATTRKDQISWVSTNA